MTNSVNNWQNELETAGISAGDKITIRATSDIDAFDGEVEAVAADAPTDNLWLELETNADGVMVIIPDRDSEGGAELVMGRAIRNTGHIPGAKQFASVQGVRKR